MTARAGLNGLTRELWLECWEASGRLSLRRRAAELLERKRRIAEDLDDVLTRHAPLPWPFGLFAKTVRRWGRSFSDLQVANADRLQGTKRARGRETRLSLFVRLMFERDPSLPTTPGPWIAACDEFGTLEAELGISRPERREIWRSVLSGKATAARTPAARRSRGKITARRI